MRRRGLRAMAAGGALLVAVLAPGCAASLADRAIAARGGKLASVRREVDGRVFEGFPGDWSWAIDYRVPDLVRWTIDTYGEEQSYVYDGKDVILYLGTASLPVDPAASASFLTQVRWIATTGLDVLADDSRVACAEVAAAELPAGAARGLRVRWRDTGATYLLWFDQSDLLIAAEGEIALPPIGSGHLRADYGDFRTVGGYRLPFSGRYVLGGRPLMDETIRRWAPNDPALTAASFANGP